MLEEVVNQAVQVVDKPSVFRSVSIMNKGISVVKCLQVSAFDLELF